MLGSRVEAGIRDPRDSMPYSTLRTCGVHNFEYCWVRFNERRHFTACVYEQHIDGRLKELTLHALCQHLAMPMILLAGRWRILRDHERPISVDRGENDRHHEAAVEKQEQDFPYLLRSLLNIHHRKNSRPLRRECSIRPKPPCAPSAVCNRRLILEHRECRPAI